MDPIAPTLDEAPRINRERRTVRAMVEMYCRDHHPGHAGQCAECNGLSAYAMARLDRCVYKDEKPTCKKCPVHCYRSDMRATMRDVMIYSGPRMLLAHPVLAIRHLLDERKAAPAPPRRPS